jgi:predicted enzyme related to lactoylglutathione lyase
MDPVVHFEMPVKDGKRASNFYSKIFGWKMQDMGSQMGHYILAHTSETDAKGMIKKPGAINGGFFPWKDNKMSSSSHVVIAVDDI